MLSRTNRWLNWMCLTETLLNSSHDLTFKRPEPNFQFHHRFCLWEDYLLVLHLTSLFCKYPTNIHALLVEMGQIKVHGTWAPGDRHQIDINWVTKGRLCLSPPCAQKSGMSILQGNRYCELLPYPLLLKSLKQQGFHTDRVCGWPAVSVWHSNRGVKRDYQAFVELRKCRI